MKKTELINLINLTIEDIKVASKMITTKDAQARENLENIKVQLIKLNTKQLRVAAVACYDNSDNTIKINTELFDDISTKNEKMIEALVYTLVHEVGHVIYNDNYYDIETGLGHSAEWLSKTNELTAAMRLLDKKYRFLVKPCATCDSEKNEFNEVIENYQKMLAVKLFGYSLK